VASIKTCEDKCYQLIKEINYARSHRLHANLNQCDNQIKSVEEKLKTGIPESLRVLLMALDFATNSKASCSN
jgi:hypothetical protein